MKTVSKLQLEGASALSQREMKNIVGGVAVPGDDENPKIEACRDKKRGDHCRVTLEGTEYKGTCDYFFWGPLYCCTFKSHAQW